MRITGTTTFLGLLLLVVSGMARGELEIGVVTPRGVAEADERWGELAKYLSIEVKELVHVVPMSAAKILDSAKTGEVDFILSQPGHALQLLDKVDGQVIATVNGKSGARFGGVIVAKKGSGITTLADLRGKKVVSMNFQESAGAHFFQVFELKKAGIDAYREFASFTAGAKQDELVMAVKNGTADVAFVRTGLLEKMAKDGKIKLDELEIVNAQKVADFTEVLSTALYPEWCVTGLSYVSPQTIQAVKTALLAVKDDSQVARVAEIRGFVEPIPLDSIKEVLKALKISPYDK